MKIRKLLTLAPLSMAAAALSWALPLAAAPLGEWHFDEAQGTPLAQTLNTGSLAPATWGTAGSHLSATTGDGAYRIQESSGTHRSAFVVGTLVKPMRYEVEVRSFSFSGQTTNERVRFGFLTSTGGNVVEMVLARHGTSADPLIQIQGEAFINSSTQVNIPAYTLFTSNSRAEPFWLALEFNQPRNEYEIFYRLDSESPWISIGVGDSGGGRTADRAGLGQSGTFAGGTEHVAISHVRITEDVDYVEPIHYWTWQGEPGVPNVSGTWWHDKLGDRDMSLVGRDGDETNPNTPVQVEIVPGGPGSAFPNPTPVTGAENTHVLNTLEGHIRTSASEEFHRNSFTFEIFFNAVQTEELSRLFDMSQSSVQAQGLVRNNILSARVYPPNGSFDANTNVDSTLSVDPNVDYYAAFAISTGPDSADRFVDFYLKDLTNDGPLQHERVGLDDSRTSLHARTEPGSAGLSLRIGRNYNFPAIGDVRYSAGVLDPLDLIYPYVPPPPAPHAYWTWSGEDGTPGTDGTWWREKSGRHTGLMDMRSVGDTVSRIELPASGPGSAFPSVIPGTEEPITHGVDLSNGQIGTHRSNEFNRDSFMIETFFHLSEVPASDTYQIFRLLGHPSPGNVAQGVIRNGNLAARVYTPAGDFDNAETNIQSGFSLSAGIDYYAAIGISTGPNPEDRFVDFYLQDLTNMTPVQQQRVGIWDGFTSLNQPAEGTHLTIGMGDMFAVMGAVRYFKEIVGPESLMFVHVEPLPPASADLYWGSWGAGASARIVGANLDGSDVRAIFDGTGVDDQVMNGKPMGITITADYIYWVDLGVTDDPDRPGGIWRATRSGEDARLFVERPASVTGLFRPQSVVVDEANGKLYFSEWDNGLYSADLETGGNVTSLGSPSDRTTALVLLGDDRILSVNAIDTYLWVTDIATQTHQTVVDLRVHDGEVHDLRHYGLALDAANQIVYFTGFEAQLGAYDYSSNGGDIATGEITFLVTDSGQGRGISLTEAGQLFYVESGAGRIFSYNTATGVRSEVVATSGFERPDTGVAAWGPATGEPPLSGYAAWAQAKFGEDYGDESISGRMADPDGDGLVNLLEYAFNTHPLQPNVLNLQESIQTVGGEEFLTITFERREGIDDLDYVVEVSTDLVDWVTGEGDYAVTTADGIETVTYFDSESISGSSRRFLRVSVVSNE